MNETLINKIAKKIIMSFVHFRFKNKYSNGIKSGAMFWNYFNFPVACGYKKRNDYFLLICNDVKEAYKKVFYSHSKSAEEIKKYLEQNGNTLSNFKKAIKNFFTEYYHGITEKDDYMVKSIQKLNLVDFKKKLINDYEMNILDFSDIFGIQDEYYYEKDNMTFWSIEPLDSYKKKINQICKMLKSLLPSSLYSKLLYGNVQIRGDYLSNAAAQYWEDNDIIILNIDFDVYLLVKNLIHELGHRWYDKFANSQQLKQFRKLFNNANGKYVNLEIADIITFIGDDEEYIYVGIDENGKMLLESLNAQLNYHKKIDVRQFDTINGQKIQKYNFPSDYSKTRFTEFVPECISCCYCGTLEDKKLEQKIKGIMES